jgi:serine/threonine-protein kinase
MIGRSINNYRIRAQIGQGGMGTVYVAEHPFMGRKAAIKILRRAYLGDEGVVALFMNEARAANAIRHPNIVDIIDVGRLEDGQPYLMMEFLEGETLGDRLLRMGRLPPPDALDFVQQAAEALAVAHDRGIVHRDLKPENLLLVPDLGVPRGERVKVLDFGIAKLRGPALQAEVPEGPFVLGSPIYMAPEQCSLDATEIDHRADIYALGGLLYHTLYGAPPFVNEALGGLLAMHLHQAPVVPRSIDPLIPAHVEEAILRSLAKRPEDRFSSMRALVAALRAAPLRRRTGARQHDLADRDPTCLTRLSRGPERRRAARWRGLTLGAIAAAALALALGPPPQRVTAAVRSHSLSLVTRMGRAAGLLPRPDVARPPEPPPPSRPIVIPLARQDEPPDELPPPRRAPGPRAHAGLDRGLLGIGREVLDREDLWGRRH